MPTPTIQYQNPSTPDAILQSVLADNTTTPNTVREVVEVVTLTTATLSNVVSSGTSVTLLALNALRRSATFFNDSTQVLYLKFGATASTSSYTVQLAANGYFELPQPCYTGRIDGIWASANGNARVTEVVA